MALWLWRMKWTYWWPALSAFWFWWEFKLWWSWSQSPSCPEFLTITPAGRAAVGEQKRKAP